jgi:hypothetical protein
MIKKYKYEIIIFLLAVLIRLPHLGHDSFNTDVWRWKTRTYNFSNGVFTKDFGLTLQKYHPGVTLMWLGSAGIKVYNFYYDAVFGGEPASNSLDTVFGLNSAQKYFVVLAISFALACCFYILRKLFDLKFAVVSIIFLLSEPFYSALAREYHLEGLMSTFMFATVLLGFYWFTNKQASKWVFALSAFFASLAILTKVTALFVIPFVLASFTLFTYLEEKSLVQTLSKIWKKSTMWTLFVVGMVFLLWPALWVRPLDAFGAVYEGIFNVGVDGGHAQFYFGHLVEDPGLSFYFVALFLRSSIFLLPGLIGYFVWAKKHAALNTQKYVWYMLAFSLLYLVPMLLSSKKLDRYMLPTLMGLSFISSVFYYYIISAKSWLKYLLAFVVIVWSVFLIKIHPDYLSYYSPFGGGLRAGMNIIEPKWLIGAPEIQQFLRDDMEKNNKVAFVKAADFRKIKRRPELMQNKLVVAMPEKYYAQAYPFVNETGAWAVVDQLADDAKYANYFIYPVWDDTSDKVTKHKLKYYDSVYVRGIASYKVYLRMGD